MGAAPYVGGGFGHFYAYAPVKLQYPIDRFAMETKRQLDLLDRRLADNEFIAGDYSIADIAAWPWYAAVVTGDAYDAAEFLSVHEYKHLGRWVKAVGERPAVARGRRVNRVRSPCVCPSATAPRTSPRPRTPKAERVSTVGPGSRVPGPRKGRIRPRTATLALWARQGGRRVELRRSSLHPRTGGACPL